MPEYSGTLMSLRCLLEAVIYNLAAAITSRTILTTFNKTQTITGITGSLKWLFQDVDNFLQSTGICSDTLWTVRWRQNLLERIFVVIKIIHSNASKKS